MKTKLVALGLILAALAMSCGHGGVGDRMVLLPVDNDPTVSFRVLFNAGSQNDPPGKEGLAALTASMITEGSTRQHSYEEILELLYPMAAGLSEQVDKEMTVFYGRTHIDNLDGYYALLKEVLLEPAFKEEDFERVKTNMLNYVRTTLRYSQDEELGKEALYEFIFAGTPYGHNEEGWVRSLESITLDDVKSFYETHYTWDNVTIGLGGGFDSKFAKAVEKDFKDLPHGEVAGVPAPRPKPIRGMNVFVIEKDDAAATAISFGFPIDVTRGSRDFYALALATSWLGEHRNSFSHLYQVIRERRGLNYGDYAYIEHFPGGHRRQFPPPNVARRSQVFQVWIRPVPNDARLFAFRAALRELEKLVQNGMSQEDFELTRKFLKGYILHYAPTTMAKLGYAMDDRFYGNEHEHWATFERTLDELTLDEVNAAIKKYLTFGDIKAVFITPDAAGLKEALVNNEASPISYQSEKPAEIYEEDEKISAYPLEVQPGDVTVVEIDQVFEG